MKALVVEDDFTSRILLQKVLAPLGEVHVAVNGKEAVMAFQDALAEPPSYDTVFLDILMPEMDGQEVLRRIRDLENQKGIGIGQGVKIIMATALGNKENVMQAFRGLCDGYLVKPYDRREILAQLRLLGLPAGERK